MKTHLRIGTVLAVLSLPAIAQNPNPPVGSTPSHTESTQNPAPAAGTDVAQALDQKVENLTISGVELPAALADLGRQVGIQITLDEDAVELLPWGRQTKLKDVSVSHASLREALPQILGPLGMTYAIRDMSVVVIPTDALGRMTRRATWDELKLLRRAMETEYTPQAFADFKVQYRITAKVDAPKLLNEQMEKAGQGSVAQILETATGSLGWIWFPEDDHFVIRTQQAQIANKLSRRITAKYTNVPLSQILMELADKSDIALHLEPGMMLKLPASAQSYSLSIQSSSVRQALELIAADIGLTYDVHADGISIKVAESGQSAPTSRGGPYALKISIPSKDNTFTYDFFLREDELPPEVVEHSHEIKDRMIKSLMEELAPDTKIRSGGDKK
jgi:hypothetical protein